MTMGPPRAYFFGDFELKATDRVLMREGRQVPLGSKAFEVLTCLVRRPGEPVTKDELLKTVWPDAFVEEGNLTQQISALRKALGDSSSYIVTIPGKGYQFAAEVKVEFPALLEHKPAREIAAKAARPSLFVVESRPRMAVQPAAEEEEEDALPSPNTAHGNAGRLHRVDEISMAPSPDGSEERRRSRSPKFLWWTSVITVAALVAVTGYLVVAHQRRFPFEHFTIQKVTESGNVPFTAISPDGVYLASVLEDAEGNESLWVHHIPTGSERPILQDAAFHYMDVTFSPDESFVYFRVQTFEDKPVMTSRTDLYRIPILGGNTARIAKGVDAQASFIEKGRRLCFYRENKPATYAFMSAAADGGDERVLFTGTLPYPVEAACAPDGRRAVVEDGAGNIEIRDFDSGSTQTLRAPVRYDGWLSPLNWAQNGKGVFGIYHGNGRVGRQIAFLSYPGGVLRQITNDLSQYVRLNATANADVVAATVMERSSVFDEISLTGPATIQEHPLEGLQWFFWIDSHTILTADRNEVLSTVYLTDGKTITLSLPAGAHHRQPAPCGPNAMVVTGRDPDSGKGSIYKMNLDGSGAIRITGGPNDLLPACTADGRWLFYNDNREDTNSAVMRMPLSGGPAQIMTGGQWSSVSPDGKMIAVFDKGSGHLNVFLTETLSQLKSLPMPADVVEWIAFSADSRSIFYIREPRLTGRDTQSRLTSPTRKEATIWRQPLDGSASVKVAAFPGRYVYWIGASPDGTKLGATVMTVKYNAVLLRETR